MREGGGKLTLVEGVVLALQIVVNHSEIKHFKIIINYKNLNCSK